jgi:DNA-binding transcriptional LysR family regulator
MTSPITVRIGRLRVRHLQLLDAIGRHQSLTVAAASVGTSQPRATNMLRELEDAFGCRLLDRSPRGVRLNAAGATALERLRIALGALDAAQQSLQSGQGQPLVRLGVLPLVGSDKLSQVVADLQSANALPRLVLRVGTVGELLALLVAGEVDGVICGLDAGRPAPDAGARLHVVNLWEERNLVVAARDNPVTRKRSLSLQNSLQHPWLLMPPHSANRQALERMFLRAGLAPPVPAIETETPQMAVAYVARGKLLALVPETAVAQAAAAIRPVRMDCDLASTWINLITLRDVPRLPFVEELAERLIRVSGEPRSANTAAISTGFTK